MVQDDMRCQCNKMNDQNITQGVILAAGGGSRIFPLSFNFPKPLLPILNKPVMQYQIEAMHEAGIDKVVVVIGKKGAAIREFFGSGKKWSVALHYIVDDNPQGIASSLMCAKPVISSPFVLFLGDIFLPRMDVRRAMERLVKNRWDGVIIARQDEAAAVARNFAIVYDKNKRVLKVIEKPKNPPTLVKGYGLYLFSPAIFEAIEQTPRSALRGEYEITDAIQTLVDMGGKVFCELWDLWDFNLTYPSDLLECNLKMLSARRLRNLVGRGAKINSQVKIVSSVIGDRARVEAFGTITECLVFADTKVEKVANPSRIIFANKFVIPI